MVAAPADAADRWDEPAGGIRSRTVGGIRMCEIVHAGTDSACVGDADTDVDERHCLVALQLDGGVLMAQGGIEVRVRTGDVAVIDGGRVHWWDTSGPWRQLRLYLPQAWLRTRLPGRRSSPARVLAGNTGLGALLGGLMERLRSQADGLDAVAQAAVRNAVVELVVAALAGVRFGGRAVPTSARRWPALCAYIEARLPEPSLSPADVARANGISTRHLHRLFQCAGTSFGAFVRNSRLARCRADLADPRCASLPVTAIAFRWGFSNSGHFSRSFKAAYGTTARAFRSRSTYSPVPVVIERVIPRESAGA